MMARSSLARSRPAAVAVMAVACSLALAATGMPSAVAASSDPELLTKNTATLVAGETAWVALQWLGVEQIDDFKVEIAGLPRDVEVAYPENTTTSSSPAKDSTLKAGELDYTAVRLSVPYAQTKGFAPQIQASWTAAGKASKKTYKVDVPVTVFSGSDFTQVTTTATVSRSTPVWLDVRFTGSAPVLDDFEVSVSEASGMEVVYPGDRGTTSLQHDASLSSRETDLVRFRVDAGGVQAGPRTITLAITYDRGGTAATATGTLAVTVE